MRNGPGVQEGNGSDAKITFAIAKNRDGKPGTLFVPPDGQGWFWLFAGHHANDKLHIFLPRQEKTKGDGAFGFKAVDLWLGTVSNPLDEPTKWKIDYTKVPFADFTGSPKRSFGSAVMRVQEHAYIYGFEEKPARPFASRKLIVARAPADKLADFQSWRFLANGEWKSDVKDATAQIDGLGTEFSVGYFPGLKKYVLVTTDHGLSDRILGSVADTPEGPWSDAVLLYTCPEMKQDKKTFTYAAKAHPHLSSGNDIVISYAVNAFELAPVINNAELYWPRFVRVTFK